jgi:hypothetical protein
MQSAAATTAVPRRLRRSRSGVALPRVDGRLRASRRFKQLAETFAGELGGGLSEVDQNLIVQAAGLTLAAEQLSAGVIAGNAVDADAIVRISSEARRVLAMLRAKAAKNKPAGPSLADYLARKAAEKSATDEAA